MNLTWLRKYEPMSNERVKEMDEQTASASKRIYLASPHLIGNEREYVENALDSNWVAPLGAYVDRFEQNICNKIGCDAAVALSSGTAALHLALVNARVMDGDVVFCSDLTFIASANPICYCGGKIVFIDSESETFNMSPVALERAFEKYSPKAVIVASIYGIPAKLDELSAICKKHGVPMIEDSTESLGSTYNNKYAGTFGKYGTFSFNGNKIITSSGGGMLVSNDCYGISHAFHLATQARVKGRFYEHDEIGNNYRLSNVSAAIGVAQLEKLEEKISMKKEICDRYDKAFKEFEKYGVRMLQVPDNRTSNYWLSVLVLGDESRTRPEDIVDTLARENIEARHIWKPLHTQPVFGDSDFITEADNCKPNSDYLFTHGVCMPSDTNMTESDQDRVISIVRTCLDWNTRLYYQHGY